ncbi:MAG: cold shock domain-containing protein [Thiobacillus sp.]|nr:cold shock domain-containing protein [Thiobacillus sp.]
MRTEGTLCKWNDDRGFGFITPTQGGPEVFAHISAFAKDGHRPLLGERLIFEIGTGKDGKQQAKHILYPDRPTEKPYRRSEPTRRPNKPGMLGRIISLGFMIALGAYGYNEYTHGVAPQTAYEAPSKEAAAPSPFHCDGRTHCSQMTSCAEAEFFLSNCPNVEMDGNNDGEPCEQQWCN